MKPRSAVIRRGSSPRGITGSTRWKTGRSRPWVCGRKDGARERFGGCTFHAHAVTECLDTHVFMEECGLSRSRPSSADASRPKSRLASMGIPQRRERKLLKSQYNNKPMTPLTDCGAFSPRSPSLPSATHFGMSVIPLKGT